MAESDVSEANRVRFIGLLLLGLLVPACSKSAEVPAVSLPAEGEIADADLERLILVHAQAAQAAPNDAARRATLGLVYEANQVWTLAARSFESAIALDSQQPSYALHAAIAMLRCGRSSEADALIRETVARFPDFAPARYRLGISLLDEGQAAEALAEFEACRRLAPWFAETRVAEGEALERLGRYAEALQRVEDSMRERPGSQRAHFVRGLALQGLGQTEAAEAELTAGQGAERSYLPDEFGNQLTGYIVDTRILLGAVEDLRSKGWEAEVWRMLETAHERKPNDPLILNALALAERRRKNAVRASELLERAVTLDPDTIEFRINAALAFLDRGLGAEAMAQAERAVQLDPENVRAQVVLGLSFSTLGEKLEAVRVLENARRLDPTSYMVLLSLAEVQVDLKRYDLALPLAQELVRTSPDKYWPRHFLCLSQLRMGLLEEARENLDALRTGFPGDPRLEDLELEFR